MSQCVPSWDLVDQSVFHERPSLRYHSSSTAPDVPLLDYEVAELTWENGQVAMHGFGVPRLSMKPASSNVGAKYTWDKPRASGTLESIVNQATHAPPRSKASFNGGAKNEDLVPWFDHRRSRSASATIAMDALVPCSNRAEGPVAHVIDTSLGGCSIDRVGSCSVAGGKEDAVFVPVKRAKVARVPSPQDWSSGDLSVSGSDTIEKDSQHLSLDTYDDDSGAGFTSTSPENTISGRRCSKSTTIDDHNSICHSRPTRFAGEDDVKKKRNRKASIKRSRAAAVHNQSERKRRDKINQRMKTLQKLVPNSSKTDKASMLDEVIEYLKQLQAQVQMMRMHTPAMMLPLSAMTAMQQQLQMSMLQASMGLGPMMGAMGMGMGVDMNSIGRANISAFPPVLHPAAPFMFVNPWDSSGDRLQAASSGLMPDPLSAFLPCQSLPINMEAYCRLAAMYQQFQQPPMSSSKN